MQSATSRFSGSVPGQLASHSALVSWPESLLELDVGGRGVLGGDGRGRLAVEIEAHGADRQRIVAGAEPVGGKGVAACIVGGHRRGDGGIRPGGGHRHAAHRRAVRAAHAAGDRRLVLGDGRAVP
jgi:hypothetical protein